MTSREFLVSNWPMHPAAAAAVVLLLGLFVVRWLNERPSDPRLGRSRRRPGFGTSIGAVLVPDLQVLWLFLALGVFWLALDSPLDVLAARYLFSAHMLQHLLLLLVVPPLLLLAWGGPDLVDDPGPSSPASLARAAQKLGPTRRWLTKPAVTWLAGAGAMWFWHVPALCDAATSNPWLRGVQTASLVALGCLFWLPILGAGASQRLSPLGGLLYLFTACVACTLLGIYITFSPVSVCPVYLHAAPRDAILNLVRERWGLTPVVDQQLGGLLMWVPACLIYLCGMLGWLGQWYSSGAQKPKPLLGSRAEPRTA